MMQRVWKLPVPSTSLMGGGVVFEKRLGREIALRYEMEGGSGEPEAERLVFTGVEAFKCTNGRACSEWMLGAYDHLIDVASSPWLHDVTAQLKRSGAATPALRHLAIYFDDGPCYEILCTAFRIDR
jgi:hypothetical protein